MAKDKASKEGSDIGVDLASNIAKAITRVLSTYDFSPLNKSLTKGMGTIDVSSLIKSSDAKIKQLAVDIKSSLEKSVGNVSITPTLDTTPLEKAGDLVRTLVNLTEEANKKTAITADLYEKITATANELVASKRMEKEAAESLAKAYEAKLPPTPDVNPFQDIANVQQQIVDSTATQALNYSRIDAEQVKQVPRGEEILKLLKQAKLQHKDIDTLVGAMTQGQYKLVEAHKSSKVVLAGVTDESKIQKILNDTLLQQGVTQLGVIRQQGASAKELTAADQKQYQALENTLTARELLIDAAQQLVDAEGNQLASANILTNVLEDELDLVDSIAASYGLSGKAAQFFSEKIKEGADPAEIIRSTELEAVKVMEKSIETRKKILGAQGEGISLNNKLQDSYENVNKLLEQTLQHSNLIFFEQVDVTKALEDQKRLRIDLIGLAQQEGAAGEGARALMQAEVGLFNQQVDLLGYQGESAAYVVEQLKKGRDISSIQKDQQLEILETQQKSIDFRKKDLELQSLTKKRIEEIKKSHDGIKDRIKQTLDFSKELAKDPKALGMFAAAQVGIGLHKANHAMHELVDSGMQAGEAVHVMADGISVMSVLGLSKVSGINKELINQFGTMNVLTKDQRHTIGEMATKFGLAEKEAVDLTMAISRMPGESADTATNFANTAKHVGKMSGVMPSQIMKEMAKNSGLMSTYSKGGAEGFAKAAAQAKKMGVELSSVLSAAEKTLDFENSINAQMEASLLIGKSMNFDKMRAAALSGDANAIMEEQAAIMQQVGSLDNMNVLQKKKLAEAMGLTVDELTKMNEAQQFQNKYFGENASAFDNVVGGVMKYGGAAVDFVAKNGMMILGVIQATTQIMALRAVKAANTAATLTDTTVTNANTTAQKLSTTQLKAYQALRAANIPAQQAMTMARNADTTSLGTNTGAQNLNQTVAKKGILTKIAERTQRLLGIATTTAETGSENLSAISKQKNTGLTSMQTLTENARRFGRMLGLGVTTTENALENTSTATKGRGIIATLALNAATLVRNVIVGAGNVVLGLANGLLTLFGVNTATAGAAGAGAAPGIVAFGTAIGAAGAAMVPAIPIILAIGAALWMAQGSIAVFGEVLKTVAVVVGNVLMKALEMLPAIIGSVAAGFVTIFSTLAQNWQILIPVGVGLVTVAAGLTSMGAAGFFAYPGLLLAGLGLMAMVPGLTLINMLTQTGGIMTLTTALVGLGAAGPGLALVGASLAVVAASLGGMAIAGLAAMPIIGALAGLAAVAPMLAGLGNLFGGGEKQEGNTQTITQTAAGGGDKEDKMNILIEEIRGLRIEMSKGGVVNMDGRKVGEAIRLRLNTGGIT